MDVAHGHRGGVIATPPYDHVLTLGAAQRITQVGDVDVRLELRGPPRS